MKKKILFIIWSFSYGGGAEKILSNVVNNMNPDKYEIDILEYYHSDIKEEQINSNINLLPPIIDSTKKGFFNKVKTSIIYRCTNICPKLLRKRYLNKKYDVEISFNYLIPTYLLDLSCKKKISWIHSSIYDLQDNKFQREKQRKVFKDVDTIVAISKKSYQSIIDIYPEYKNKTIIINNGFEFDKIKELTKDKKSKKSVDLLYCGRLEERKNPLRLIEIVKILKDRKVDFTVGFLGQGDEEDKIKQKVSEYGLEKHVIFYGFNKNPYPIISSSKIFCMTSTTEGFPTVIAEAMTFGIPFVSTPVAGTEEMSKNGLCGFVTDDNEEFADKIVELMTNDKLYKKMSKECTKHVRNFSMETQIEKLEQLLNEGE